MKHLTLIIALLWALGASGQIYINSFTFGAAPAANLLLDDYPNAAAAYSLRLLRTAYTGNCIVVRRASNNDTLAIGFSGNYLDTAALKTFCASTDCFVQRWYDQGGNVNNVVQTTGVNQPQIIASGALITHANGTPALLYDGTNDILQGTVSQIVSASGASLFYVYSTNLAAAQNTNTACLWAFLGNYGATSGILRLHGSSTGATGATNETMFLDARLSSSGLGRLISSTYARAANTVVYESNIYASTGTTFFQNGSSVSLTGLNEGVTTSTDLRPITLNWQSWLDLGGFSYGTYANQRISEFIVYASDQTINRTGIESNIDSFY